MEAGELGVGRVEGVVVGIADARHDVPVVPGPARQRQRRARRGDVQPPLRVEHVGEAEQVVLVGAAAVVQDEQAGGVARRRALAEDEVAHGAHSVSWGARAHGPPAAAWA